MPKPKIDQELCFGCMNCTIYCPRGVLTEPQTGMIPLTKTLNECTGCRRCVKACPHNAIIVLREIAVSFT